VPQRKRKFGELSKSARDRAARAGSRFGLTRRQVRERYNRGTYSPFANEPSRRVPTQYRPYASAGTSDVDWQEAALDNMRKTFEDYFKFNDDAVVYYTSNMSDEVARLVAMASEDELLQWASMQPDGEGNPPPIENWGLPPGITLDDVSAYVDGQWNNIFWYH
jgi:hypothetical protein